MQKHTHLHGFEGQGEVVVLQHGVVVVEQCQLVADVDEELVGLARVSHVVDGCCHQCCQHLHRGEDTLCVWVGVCVWGGGGGGEE